jgi:hypothetical protein
MRLSNAWELLEMGHAKMAKAMERKGGNIMMNQKIVIEILWGLDGMDEPRSIPWSVLGDSRFKPSTRSPGCGNKVTNDLCDHQRVNGLVMDQMMKCRWVQLPRRQAPTSKHPVSIIGMYCMGRIRKNLKSDLKMSDFSLTVTISHDHQSFRAGSAKQDQTHFPNSKGQR